MGTLDRANAIVGRIGGARFNLRSVWVSLYFLIVALCVMQPYHGARLAHSASGDLTAHVAAIVEATTAMREGQFPLRVAPYAAEGARYPLFNFYGNLPYTVSAAIALTTGVNPYTAFKLVLLGALWLGGAYTYRCAHWLTRHPSAALVAGTAFTLAPYVFTDVHARTAFPESVGFMLLPVVLYYVLRAFSRGQVSDAIAGALVWAALALAHNVVFLFGSVAMFAFLLTLASRDRRYVRRLCRVGIAYGLGVAMVLWYLVPQAMLVPDLWIASLNAAQPVGSRLLTSLEVLLWPTMRLPTGTNTPDLGLQIGWPILFGVVAVIAAKLAGRGRATRPRVATGLLIALAVSFFVAWSPERLDFWSYVPKLFWHVQSTFRLLMFVVLWGSLLLAWAVAAWVPVRCIRCSRLVTTCCLLGVAVTASAYVRPKVAIDGDRLAMLTATPDFGGNGARDNFLIRHEVAIRTTPRIASLDYAGDDFGVMREGWLVDEQQPFYVWPPPAGWVLEIQGELPRAYFTRDNLLWAKLGTEQLAPTLVPPGPFKLRWPVTAPQADRPIGLTIQSNDALSALDMNGLAPLRSDVVRAKVSHLRFVPPAGAATSNSGERFLSASSLRSSVKFAKTTELSVSLDEPTLVQIPVLFYANCLRVRDSGQPIDYVNVGRYVAVRLASGRHDLQVEFAGIAWANAVSAVTVVGVGIALLLALRRKRWRSSLHPVAGAIGPRYAIFTAAVVVTGSLGPTMYAATSRSLDRFLHPDVPCTYLSDRTFAPSTGPEQAFDGDVNTAWIVDGIAPATLTIVPSIPGVLSRIDLEPRHTMMLEGWNRVNVKLFLEGEPVGTAEFQLPNAFSAPLHSIIPPAVKADHIELTFSDPVTLLNDGITKAGEVNPGLREVRLRWQGKFMGYTLP